MIEDNDDRPLTLVVPAKNIRHLRRGMLNSMVITMDLLKNPQLKNDPTALAHLQEHLSAVREFDNQLASRQYYPESFVAKEEK